MTSEEIKKARATDYSTNGWLKELAYQVALLNEKQTPASAPVAPRKIPAVGEVDPHSGKRRLY